MIRALLVLVGNEHHVPSTALTDRFRSVHDASTFLLERIARIHARWLEQRGTAHQQDASTHAALVYTALDEAEIAFARLGREPDVEQFLRVGVTSEHEEVSIACREIAVTVGLQLAPQQEGSASTASGPSLLGTNGATR